MDTKLKKILSYCGLGILVVATIFGIWKFYGSTGSRTSAENTASNPVQNGASEKKAKTAEKNVIESKTELPVELSDAGEFAENIYDAAKSGDWTMADAKQIQLTTALEKLDIKKIDVRTIKLMMPELKAAISGRKKMDVQIVSNRLTFALAEMSGKYDTALPVGIVKLDYYGRELEIWSENADLQQLQKTASEIRKTWDRVRPEVEKNDGSEEADTFEALVEELDSAETVEDYAKLATPILDEVDNLEGVFE